MNVGVACAHDDAVVAVEQEVAVQSVSPGLDREEGAEQRGAVGDGCGRDAPGLRIQLDVAVREIYCPSHERGQRKQPKEPVLDRDIDRQREEVEADVLVEQRIVSAVRRLVEEAEDKVPVSGLAPGDQKPEDDREGQDEKAPNPRRRLKSVRPARRPPK
jgi:hypothetical protein